VVETDPPGYFSTTPNTVTVNVMTLDEGYVVNFGDAPVGSSFASIHGTVFEDLNGNGVQDDGEQGIPNVWITLDGVRSVMTGLYGGYTFTVTSAGLHTVEESDPPGYFSTTPNTVTLDVQLGNGYTVDFGDAPDTADFAVIYGYVFLDVTGSGGPPQGKLGIRGVTVTLDGIHTARTNRYGWYMFSTAVSGTHTVVETDLPGYFSTTPNTVTLSVYLGQSYRIDFGDARDTSGFATIYGTVFEDEDLDGEWDVGERGISGVLLTLDGTVTTTTGLYGGYTFSTTVPGVHMVVETDPPNYESTTLNDVQVDVVLGNGYEVNFGDVEAGSIPTCTCPADGYEEDDVAVEAVRLPAGQMQLHDFCDDATDWITFTAQAGAFYTITTAAWGQRADTALALYDTDARTLLAFSDDFSGTTDFSSRIVWQAQADGVYYVRTSNRARLTGCHTEYELWIEEKVEVGVYLYLPLVMREYGPAAAGRPELYPQGIITHTCPDAYEVDDTWQQAHAILPGVPQVHSFDSDPQLYAADKDYVWFLIEPGDTLTLTVAQLTNTQTLLELYDGLGTFLGVTGTTRLVVESPTGGRYIVGVSPVNPTSAGCAHEVGYALLISKPERFTVYLPLVMREY
jgi:hypothetical protein